MFCGLYTPSGAKCRQRINFEQEGRALWRNEPPRDATFAHTPIVFRTKFGDVPLELDR